LGPSAVSEGFPLFSVRGGAACSQAADGGPPRPDCDGVKTIALGTTRSIFFFLPVSSFPPFFSSATADWHGIGWTWEDVAR